jgi:hypothetical protein
MNTDRPTERHTYTPAEPEHKNTDERLLKKIN